MFTETKVQNGRVYTKAYQEKQEPKSGKKYEKRARINNEVFDIHDSVADNAKWASILTSFIVRLYDVMPEEQKALLDPNDRAIIEYMLNGFKATNTRMDIALQQDGTDIIDRMLERQQQIANIIAE